MNESGIRGREWPLGLVPGRVPAGALKQAINLSPSAPPPPPYPYHSSMAGGDKRGRRVRDMCLLNNKSCFRQLCTHVHTHISLQSHPPLLLHKFAYWMRTREERCACGSISVRHRARPVSRVHVFLWLMHDKATRPTGTPVLNDTFISVFCIGLLFRVDFWICHRNDIKG